ncbi:MAG TPA: glycosyltransferase, partial [bacterium]|nr:glycosyltransferase [bacterium]
DDRLTLLDNGGNLGVTASFNRAMETARGRYIAFLGADDISLPERLTAQCGFLEENPGIGVLGAWMRTFGSRRRLMRYPEHDAGIRVGNLFICSVGHPSVTLRKEVFAEKGIRFNGSLRAGVDYDLWSRAEAAGVRFHNLQRPLVRYRTHAGQITSGRRGEQLATDRMVKRFLLERLGLTPSEDELDLHCGMMLRKTVIGDAATADAYVAWTGRILDANRKSGVYDQAELEHYLRQWLTEACAAFVSRSGQALMAPGLWSRG